MGQTYKIGAGVPEIERYTWRSDWRICWWKLRLKGYAVTPPDFVFRFLKLQ